MAIEISGINKNFGDFEALKDINLTIPGGSLTALLGPSGGGKSTLLRIIAGLESSDSGLIEIEGRDATNVPAQKRNVGFVFQHYAAFKHMSVEKNIAFGLEIRKRPKKEIAAKVDELLALVHLEQWRDRLPAQLSGGQRQRMALARALAIEPSVLLLDEPFEGLAPAVVEQLFETFDKLRKEVAIIIVDHHLDLALALSDTAVALERGRVTHTGPSKALKDDYELRRKVLWL